MARTAREIMTGGADCVGERDSISDAARMMARMDVGALPICGEDNRLHGVLTDRDIVVKVLADGRDPSSTTAGDVAQGTPVFIDADASADEALRLMAEHRVRRLPVIDNRQLIGMISQADIAINLDEGEVGRLVESISAAP